MGTGSARRATFRRRPLCARKARGRRRCVRAGPFPTTVAPSLPKQLPGNPASPIARSHIPDSKMNMAVDRYRVSRVLYLNVCQFIHVTTVRQTRTHLAHGRKAWSPTQALR